MPAWTVIPALVAAGFVPGWLIVRQFGRGRWSLPLAFAGLALGLAALGWAALLLAEVGLFSIGWLALVWALLVGGLLALDVWRGRMGHVSLSAGPLPDPLPGGEGVAGPFPKSLPQGEGAFSPAPLPPRSPALLPQAELAFLAAWAVAAGWLFFRPHEYVLGAADAGV